MPIDDPNRRLPRSAALAALGLLFAALPACSSPAAPAPPAPPAPAPAPAARPPQPPHTAVQGWDGEVRRWGNLRAVLREGDKGGKVLLREAAGSPLAVGIGALEGLRGEIAVLDGEIWTSRPSADGELLTTVGAGPDERAALLALAVVPSWEEHVLERELGAGELDDFVRQLADAAGLAGCETFPFVVDGELRDLDGHVLNGRCPYAAGDEQGSDPVPVVRVLTGGRLVGFYSDLPPGLLTHHGSKTHVHALLPDEPLVAHVDSVVIVAGASIRIPAPPNER